MSKYKIPKWCKFPPSYHKDGMGGCLGISHGYVEEVGEKWCKKCEYHKNSVKQKLAEKKKIKE